jgi:hypothetical protein
MNRRRRRFCLRANSISYLTRAVTHFHLVLSSRVREAVPPVPQYVFMELCLVRYRDNFTFTLSRAVMTMWWQVRMRLLLTQCEE